MSEDSAAKTGTEIRFYHLQTQSVEGALPVLLSKALARGDRIVLKAPTTDAVERLNQHLWTYEADSFLPHGSRADGHPDLQPVWLTDTDENPNGAGILFLVGGAGTETPTDFTLICEIFSEDDPDAVSLARQRWKHWRDSGHPLTYWQQTPSGGWEKKA